MWRKRAYGQLAKCTEAQALRKAFPEFSGGQATAEEMEGKDTFAGPTLEHTPDVNPRSRINAEVPMALPASYPPPESTSHPLDEPNGTKWMRNLANLLGTATTEAEVVEISDHPSVTKALKSAPEKIRTQINDYLADAYAKFQVPEEEASAAEPVADEVDMQLARAGA